MLPDPPTRFCQLGAGTTAQHLFCVGVAAVPLGGLLYCEACAEVQRRKRRPQPSGDLP